MPASMPDPVVILAAAVVAAAFGWAAFAKLAGFDRWRRALPAYRLGRFEPVARLGVPLVELGVAMLVMVGPPAVAGALALALLAGFSAAILRAQSGGGERLPCGCFGSASERDFRLMLLRNTFLALPAAVLAMSGDVGFIDRLESLSSAEVVPLLLVAFAIGLLGWMIRGLAESLSTRGKM
jgi:Methylamine utilisation protein MauE